MIPPNELTQAAIRRLRQDPDFGLVVKWLEEAKNQGLADILMVQQPNLIHQLQGSTLMLKDALRTFESA